MTEQPTPSQVAGVTDPDLAAQMDGNAAPASAAPIRTLGEYLDTELQVPPELVTPRMVVKGGLTAIVSRGGVGKTSLMLTRLLRWAAGLAWLPKAEQMKDQDGKMIRPFVPVGPLRVLIIENEGAGGLFRDKLLTMMSNAPPDLRDRLDTVRKNVLVWGEGGYEGVRIDDPDKLDQVRRGIDEHDPDIVFMEPFGKLWRGNENDNTEVNNIVMMLEDLAQKMGVAIMLAHHRKKGKIDLGDDLIDFARGASAIHDGVGYMEHLMRDAKDGGKSKGKWAQVVCAKNKFADEPADVYLNWQGNDSGWYDMVDPLARIMEALDDQVDKGRKTTVDAIAQRLEIQQQLVRYELERAANRGDLRAIGDKDSPQYRRPNPSATTDETHDPMEAVA